MLPKEKWKQEWEWKITPLEYGVPHGGLAQ